MTRASKNKKRKDSKSKIFKKSPLPFFIGLALAGNAVAGPDGEEVVGGVGSISRSGNETIINQATDRLAVNWRNFDVDSDERVQFIQPSSSSVALNNILSNTASHINGRIDANGQLIFVNPHGLIFGQNSVVNAGGVLASGLSIDPNDFMNGNLTFSALENSDGVVINAGLLNAATGGSISLLGKKVQNDGLISANLGSVNFAAGREAVVTFDNEGKVGVRVTEALLQEEIGVDPAVINTGEIQAEGGKVLLTASTSQDIFSQAVNSGDLDYERSVVVNDDGSFTIGEGVDVLNSGVINVSGEKAGDVVALGENIVHSGEILADSTRAETAGHVEIHSRDTTLLTETSLVSANADQGKGGDIKLLGERVGLIDQAQVSATGLTEGGQVLVGGDYRGDNSSVRNASGIFASSESVIAANALGDEGKGGRIILWGDNSLKAYGTLSATGQSRGGFIETSAGVVNLNLSVDVSSPGEGGTWLIDPYNISIQSTDINPDQVVNIGTNGDYDQIFNVDENNAGAPSVLELSALRTAFQTSGVSHVLIETTDDDPDTDDSIAPLGDITLASPLDFDTYGEGSSLTLQAHNNININYEITDTSPFDGDSLNLDLQADIDKENGGSVLIAADIETFGGSFSASGVNFTTNTSTTINTGGGAVTLTPTGAVNLHGNITTNGGTVTIGSEDQRVSSFTSAWDMDLDGNEIYEAIATINTSSETIALGNISIYSSGDITLGAVDVGSIYQGDDVLGILLDSEANIFVENSVDVGARTSGGTTGDYITQFRLLADESITFGKDSQYDNGGGGFTNQSNVTLRADRDVSGTGDVIFAGDYREDEDAYDANIYTGGGNIDVYGANLTIGGAVDTFGQLNGEGGDITINATGAVNLHDNREGWEGETLSPLRSAGGDINVSAASFTAIEDHSISTRGDTASTVSITTTGGNATLGTMDLGSDQASDAVNTDLIVETDGGDVLQGEGSLEVSGLTVFETGTGDVTLDSNGNDFQRGVHIRQANDVTIRNSGSIDFTSYNNGVDAPFTTSQIEGDLTVDALDSGDITDSASITVDGTAIFRTTGTIVLNDDNNNFNILTVSGDSVTVTDVDGIDLRDATASSLTLSAGGNITDSGTFGNSISGDLQLSALSTSGGTTTYYDIMLDGDNQFENFRIYGANDVTITDTDGNLLIGNGDGNSYVAGNLTITSTGGDVTDYNNRAFTIDGYLDITAPGRTVDLDQVSLNYSDNDTPPSYISVNTQGVGNNQNGGAITLSANSLIVKDLNALGTDSIGSPAAPDDSSSRNITINVADNFTQTGAIQGNDVNVYGGNEENNFTFDVDSSENTDSFNVYANSGDDNFYLWASTSAELYGEEGKDTFYIEAEGITVQGIDGGTDSINGGSKDEIVGPDVDTHWTSTDQDDGTITYDSATGQITFAEVEQLRGGAGEDTFTISDNFYSIFGGLGADTITLNSDADIDTNVDGGGDGDSITLNGDANVDGNVYGGAGADTITLANAAVTAGGILGGASDDSDDSESDTLIGYNAGSGETVIWDIDTTLTIGLDGTDGNSAVDSNTTNSFSQFEILKGNDSDSINVDRFNLSTTTFTGELHGGTDADVFNITSADSAVVIYGGSGADEFFMNGANLSLAIYGNDDTTSDSDIDTLYGFDGASTWHFGLEDGTAVQQLENGTGTSTFSDIQIVQGDDSVDTFHVRQAYDGEIRGGGNNDIFNFYVSPEAILPATAKIQGGDGDDTFILHAVDAIVRVDGNGGSNTLAGANGVNTWNIGLEADTNARQLVSVVSTGGVDTSYISTFENISVLQGGDDVDTFNIRQNFAGEMRGGDGGDIFNVLADVTSTLYGEADNDTFHINEELTGRVFGGDGEDTFNLNAGVSDGDINTTWDVNGGSGNDDFLMLADISTTAINGNGGATDAITLIDTDTEMTYDWELTSENTGSINNISFTLVEQINGSDGGVDRFEFNGFSGNYGGTNGGIDGRGGDDSLLVTEADIYDIALGASLRGASSVEIFEGGGDDFTLRLVSDTSLAGTTNTWTINDTNSGTITNDNGTSLTFRNFAALEGNEANDSFEVTSGSIGSVSGIRSIDGTLGASETNTLSFASGTNAWLLDGQHQGDVSGGHTTSFTNIQNLSGAGSDTLTAQDQANTWILDSTNSVAATGASPTDTVTFSGMETLNGNDQSDRFEINTSVDMTLNGGAGDDTFIVGSAGAVAAGGVIEGGGENTPAGDRLIARDTANTWSLDSSSNSLAETVGSTYVAGFSGIETLEGSNTAADIFDFASFTEYQIDAGDSANDIADYADVAGAVSVTVSSSGISGIERFVGNQDGLTSPQTNSSTLTYTSSTGAIVAWEIFDFDGADDTANADGLNDGTVGGIEFVNFNNLIGGDGNDSFTIDQSAGVAGLTGTLTGGGNSGATGDQIFAPDVDITWTVAPQSGDASLVYDNGRDVDPTRTTTNFEGFETLNSGAGDDTFTVGQSATITLNAGEGDDVVTLPNEELDITLGNAVNGLGLNGFETLTASASFNNQLTVSSASNIGVLWDIDAPNSGSVKVGDDEAVNFDNFSILIGGDGDDTFDFTNGGSVVGLGGTDGSLNGVNGDNVLIGRVANTTWTINGNETGYLSATSGGAVYLEHFSNIETLQGQATADLFTLTNAGSFSGTIEGNGDGDTLTVASVDNQRNEWRLLHATESDRVQRLNSSGTATSSINFSGIANLTGGTGVDNFVFWGAGPYGGIVNANNGGTAIDSVDLSNLTGALNVSLSGSGVYGVQNVERIVGNGADSTLNGLTTGTNNWRIADNDNGSEIEDANGQNDGMLSNGGISVQFVDFANLTGSDNAIDNFTLTTGGSVTGTIAGGTDTTGTVVDTLTTESDNQTWTLTAAGAGNVSGNIFAGIESLLGNGSGDTLIGINQNNHWQVTGENTGEVTEAEGANSFSFAGMENLSGNRGNDVFVLIDNPTGNDGEITGAVRGTAQTFTDGGTDTLTLESASGQEINWALSTGSGVTQASVTDRIGQATLFEEFIGGNGADIFTIGQNTVTAAVDGAGSSGDIVRIAYASNTEWQTGDASADDTVAVTGQGTVTFTGIEIAEGSDSGGDTFTIRGDDGSLNTLRGRGGDDVFAVDTTTDLRLTVEGGNDTDGDELIGGNRSNQWVFDGGSDSDANTLNWDSVAGTGIDFSTIENFTGGTGADFFEVRSANQIETLRGTAADVTGAAQDTLHVIRTSGNSTAWNITGANEGNIGNGYVPAFFAIENLLGSGANDIFDFANTGSAISGLVDGAGGANDQLDLTAFTAGVVVELGPTATPGSLVEETDTLPNVNAFHIETITAAHHDPKEGENNNWLVIAHADPVQWDLEVNDAYTTSDFNEGIVRIVDNLTDLNEVEGTATRFFHFGGLQGSIGGEEYNIVPGTNITGEHRQGTGQRALNFSGVTGLVVVDISPSIISLTGNDNTLLRASSDGDFNGLNSWTIDGQNSGSFYSNDFTQDPDDPLVEFEFNFTRVNQLQGGNGQDTFTFQNNTVEGTNGALIDGFINGGGGVNTISTTSLANLTFGLNGVRTTPTTPAASYPSQLTDPVYLVNNREGVIDIANIAGVTDTGAGVTTLMSSDAGTAVWTLDANNGYRLVNDEASLGFSGIDAVAGGGADDTFNVIALGDVSDVFDGGAGNDTFNIASLVDAQHVSLDADDQGAADFVLVNVETLQASFNETGHRLSAGDTNNTWSISSPNGGSISYGAGDTQTLSFSNMAHLEGGDAQDIFQLGQSGNLSGTINGGGEGANPDEVRVLNTSTHTFVFQQTTLDAQNHAVELSENQIDLYGVEQLHASNGNSHTLLGAANADNTWNIFTTGNTLSNINGNLTFSGVANLTGGSLQDAFTFDGSTVAGLVDGGINDGNIEDTVTLRNMAGTGTTAVRLGTQVNNGEVNLANIDHISSQTSADNLTLIGDNTSNIWTIQGTNEGAVNTVTFSGFAHLEGGTGNDTFVLARQTGASEDDRITGSIDGGANPVNGSAVDSVDLLGVQDSVTVALDPDYNAYLVVANIEQVDASANGNTLVGGNNGTQTWTISEPDEGMLGGMGFSGFANLLGRDQVDIFEFTQNGQISGWVDGGGQLADTRDRVDMSELSIANVVIGDTNSGFENIEEYYGNNNSSTITAANVRNFWSVTGENSGEIQDQNGNDIAFTGFTTLVGGDVVDEFTLDGGSVSGEIRAGGGQDRLNVDLGNGLNGRVTFYGGGDADTVFINGGDTNNRFAASYSPASATENETFSYNIEQGEQTYSYDIRLAEAETVNNRVYTSVLTVNDIEGTNDTIILANNRVEFDGVRTVNIANNEGYNVVAEQNDSVLIDGNLILDEIFNVSNASVSGVDNTAMITADGISFNATGNVGTAEERLAISTGNLSLTGVRNDVFLSQQGNLTIAALSNPGGTIDIEATGNITSSGNFTSSNAVRLASDGDITLNNNHALAGMLTLLAEAGDVSLTNGTTLLGDVRAQNFALTTTGSVDDEGGIQVVNQTTINGASTSIVTLDNVNNQFELVDVTNAGTLILHDSSDNGVVVSGTAANEFSVTSPNGITSNAINAGDVSLVSGNSGVLIQNVINAENSVVAQGEGIEVNAAVNVTSSTAEQAIDLDAGGGALNIRGALLANENLAGDIELQGNAVSQFLGANIAGADILVNSATDIEFGADVSASENLNATATGAIVMDGGSNPAHAQAQNLTFTAGSGIVAEQLTAADITLSTQNGDIVQQGRWNAEGITATAANGTFEQRSNTNTTFGNDGFTVNANRVDLAGEIQSSDGALEANADGEMIIQGNIAVAGVNAVAGTQLGMTNTSNIVSSTDASLSAGTQMQISDIRANEGTVSLTAGESITDNNGEQPNVTADALVVRSGSGFGGILDADTIDTSVANMDVVNASGNIGVTNDRDVAVTALITNGDIHMVNTQGNVTMANASEGEYDRSATDARSAGGVINANHENGNVTLVINDGYLTATPGPYFRRPELIGDVIDVTTSDGFGVDRQLVVYARTELIVSGPGIRPIWAFGEEPLFGLTTDSDLIDPSIVGSVGELLIEVEGVEYVDPAVFTNVRNFAFGERPIRMPRDQLYEDELSDEDDESELY